MTKPSEVTVSDDTLDWFDAEWPREPGKLEQKRRLLQELIAERVPDAKPANVVGLAFPDALATTAHNSCRAAVLRGQG